MNEFLFEQFTDVNQYGNSILPYRLFIPKDYSENNRYPLLLFLHGAGQRGNDNMHIKANTPFDGLLSNENREKYPCIIVAPQCPEDCMWVNTDWAMGTYTLKEVPISTHLSMAYDLVKQLNQQYSIDENRNYMIGISMGGYGTWNMLLHYPNHFAAAVPIAGGGDPSLADSIKHIPIWAFHGDCDTVVPPSSSRDMVHALKAISGNITYTEYAGVEHNSWSPAFREPNLIPWLFSHSR